MKKIALLAAGIPNFRFTINGYFDRIIFTNEDVECDIYFCFWKKQYNNDKVGFINSLDEFNHEKFTKLLPKNFSLKEVVFIDEPSFLSKEIIKSEHLLGKVYEKTNVYDTSQLNHTLKLVDHCFKQFLSLKLVFELCEKSRIRYDYYMRFRIDGITNYNIDFRNYYEWVEKTVLVPSNNRHCMGNPDIPINDQLAISNFEGMKIFCSLFDNIEKYVLDEDIFFNQETLMSYHLLKNDIKILDMCLDHYLIRD